MIWDSVGAHARVSDLSSLVLTTLTNQTTLVVSMEHFVRYQAYSLVHNVSCNAVPRSFRYTIYRPLVLGNVVCTPHSRIKRLNRFRLSSVLTKVGLVLRKFRRSTSNAHFDTSVSTRSSLVRNCVFHDEAALLIGQTEHDDQIQQFANFTASETAAG